LCKRLRCSSSPEHRRPFRGVVTADPSKRPCRSAVRERRRGLRVGPVDEPPFIQIFSVSRTVRAPLSGRLEDPNSTRQSEVERRAPAGGEVRRCRRPCDAGFRLTIQMMVCAKNDESMSVCDIRCGNGATPPGSKPVARTTSSLSRPAPPTARRIAAANARSSARGRRDEREHERTVADEDERLTICESSHATASRRRAPSASLRRIARPARRTAAARAPQTRSPARATTSLHPITYASSIPRRAVRSSAARASRSTSPSAPFRRSGSPRDGMFAMFTPASPNSVPTRPMTPHVVVERSAMRGDSSISSAKPSACTGSDAPPGRSSSRNAARPPTRPRGSCSREPRGLSFHDLIPRSRRRSAAFT